MATARIFGGERVGVLFSVSRETHLLAHGFGEPPLGPGLTMSQRVNVPDDREATWQGALTLFAALEERASISPDNLAIIGGHRQVTYSEWRDAAREKAGLLWGLGVRSRDRIAVLTDNRIEWLELAMASALLGARFVPFSTWVKAPELAYLLGHARPMVLFVGDAPEQDHLVRALTDCIPGLATPDGPWPDARFPELRTVIELGSDTPRGFPDVEEWAGTERGAGVNVSSGPDPSEIAMVLYTSGSTAAPKAVGQRHRDLLINGFHIGERLGLTDKDHVFLAAPLFWSYGSANALMAALTHGSALVLQPRFEAGQAISIIEEAACTVIYTLPAMTHALVEHSDFAIDRLLTLSRGVTIGPPAEVAFAASALGVDGICNIYGSTEVYGNCCVTPFAASLERRIRSQGPPLPGVELRIVSPDVRTPLGPMDEGEIEVRGRVSPGYVNDSGAPEPIVDGDGWFRTGDTGYLDAEGWLTFTGRASEMIKTAGINVSPLEVEKCLRSHPDVEEAAVTGADHPIRGEQVVAFVRLRSGGDSTPQQLVQHCAQQLAVYKVPVLILVVSQFPVTGTGKLARGDLKRLATIALDDIALKAGT